MFREMRRYKQQLTPEETIAIFEKGSSGVLALLGDEDYPYAVPLSYYYEDATIYFHSAVTGHKIDAIHKHAKASFCVIGQDHVIPDKFTTYFRSAIAFGTIRIIEDESEKRAAIEKLGLKYSPNEQEGLKKEMELDYSRICMLALSIEHMTGKESIDLVKAKEKN